MSERNFHCRGCGSNVNFDPGSSKLACPYCGTVREIPQSEKEVIEHDLEASLREGFGRAPRIEASTVTCSGCGATTVLEQGVFAGRCAFCEAPISAPVSSEVLQPQALLPFAVEAAEAKRAFRTWLKSRWFAPFDMQRRARKEGLDGVYLPFFTFDAESETFYRGQRGTHYYVTETYRTIEDGREVSKTRQVQRTRWNSCSGVVWVYFDDVLVLASQGLPESLVRKLEPWDLEALVPFEAGFLAGFVAESDQLGLDTAFARFKERCQPTIESKVRRDIGGDEQRISSTRSAFTQLEYRHILLPVWLSAFRYGDRVFRVVVNARTGEVQGERPWSWLKIGATVVVVSLVIAAIALLLQRR